MERQQKVRELFIELINTQLKPHNVTYEDVVEDPQWYMKYRTTPEEEQKFIEHCVLRIKNELDLDQVMAEKEAQWFILQWGLALEEDSLKNAFFKATKKKKAK